MGDFSREADARRADAEVAVAGFRLWLAFQEVTVKIDLIGFGKPEDCCIPPECRRRGSSDFRSSYWLAGAALVVLSGAFVLALFVDWSGVAGVAVALLVD